MSPLEQAKKELAELRAAKKQAVDNLFNQTFDDIFVKPLLTNYTYTAKDLEQHRVALCEAKAYLTSKEYIKQQNARLDYLLLDPADNPTYAADAIRNSLVGDVEGAYNGEYWNDYNQDDPIEMHPKCIGDTSGFKGFADTKEGKEFAKREAELEAKITLFTLAESL